MKLRITGNSLRLRVSRSELARFLNGSRIEETIRFSPAPAAVFSYALDSAVQSSAIRVEYEPQKVIIILSRDQAIVWGMENEVGVYGTLGIGDTDSLEVIVEKDFACLDRSDEENQDTFANPHAGGLC